MISTCSSGVISWPSLDQVVGWSGLLREHSRVASCDSGTVMLLSGAVKLRGASEAKGESVERKSCKCAEKDTKTVESSSH